MSDELHPINPALVPFNVGEIVAFREDHDVHGAVGAVMVDDPFFHEGRGEMVDRVSPVTTEETHAMYGQIQAMGLDDAGELRLDLLVFDPLYGITEDATTIHRAYLTEIQ